MPIDATEFGSITVDGKTYEHDVIIRLSGKVEKRRKRLSKEKYGTSHIISKAEAKFVFEDGCDLLIVGAGQEGNVRLSPEASEYFDKKHCRVLTQPTPEAIRGLQPISGQKNRSHARNLLRPRSAHHRRASSAPVARIARRY